MIWLTQQTFDRLTAELEDRRGPVRAWREALCLTTARADREFLGRRLAVCRPDGGEPAKE